MRFFKPRGYFDRARIKHLYKRAFPRSERKPFSIIMKMQKEGKSDVWYFEDDSGFLGMATTINSTDTVLIDYFAVADKRRGEGHGTEMLGALLELYSPRGVFLEIEIPYEDAPDYEVRRRRREFYLRAGLLPMNTRAKLFGVDMELLGVDCALDFDAYRDFYADNLGRWAAEHIKRI